MAVSGNLDLDANEGFVDVRLSAAKGGNSTYGDGGRMSTILVEDDSYANMNDIDTRLSALDATTYTVAYMRTLTKNDKVYALRLLRDAASVR